MAFYDVDNAMMVKLDYDLPPYPTFREGIRRAPGGRPICPRQTRRWPSATPCGTSTRTIICR